MTRTHVKKTRTRAKNTNRGWHCCYLLLVPITGQQRKEDLSCKNSLLSLRFVSLRTAYFSFINLCAN